MEEWQSILNAHAVSKGILILRLAEDECDALRIARRGLKEFSVHRRHSELDGAKAQSLCITIGNQYSGLTLGLVTSVVGTTTLDSRIKVRHGRAVLPETESDLIRLLSEPRFENNLRSRLSEDTSVVKLSEKLGCHVLERLASIESNVAPLQQLASILSVPKRFSSNAASQEDALQTALAAFGLTRHAEANRLDLPRDSETALSRIHILEDAVIEHDARTVPGLSLTASDLSGRAVFESRGERLEVITANKRPLENCLGVDLIYFNAVKKSIIMLQYKMLEPADGDWIYRPDGQLQDEIERMQGFNVLGTARDGEYRLNAGSAAAHDWWTPGGS